jgi:hypothetical protein
MLLRKNDATKEIVKSTIEKLTNTTRDDDKKTMAATIMAERLMAYYLGEN